MNHKRKIDALDQWCLRMLLGIKWYQFVWNDDVRRLTKQPKLTAIIQSRRLTLFGHIMHMDNADAKRILLASPPADWRRQLGRPRITWHSTVQQDLKQHHITLPEAADLAQNRPLWRMMSTYGATQSWVARQKRRRRVLYPTAKAILPRFTTCVFSKAENLGRLFMIHPVVMQRNDKTDEML